MFNILLIGSGSFCWLTTPPCLIAFAGVDLTFACGSCGCSHLEPRFLSQTKPFCLSPRDRREWQHFVAVWDKVWEAPTIWEGVEDFASYKPPSVVEFPSVRLPEDILGVLSQMGIAGDGSVTVSITAQEFCCIKSSNCWVYNYIYIDLCVCVCLFHLWLRLTGCMFQLVYQSLPSSHLTAMHNDPCVQ